jgi:hypothetical protein
MKNPHASAPMAENVGRGGKASPSLSGPESSIGERARQDANVCSAAPVGPTLDLDGFDLTDFARFLRATDPAWCAETGEALASRLIFKALTVNAKDSPTGSLRVDTQQPSISSGSLADR